MSRYRVKPDSKVSLDDFDPGDTSLLESGKQQAAEENGKIQRRLNELQELLYAEHKHRILIILQGMDTSGKDGTVRHVMGGFDPAGVSVVAFKKPTPDELGHDSTDRAFRIGQTRNVQVHKFVCGGTVEEKIDQLIEGKKEIASSVVGTGEGWLTELSNAELRDLFALRADAVGE